MLVRQELFAWVQDTAKSGLQVASSEGTFKLQGPFTKGATQVCPSPGSNAVYENGLLWYTLGGMKFIKLMVLVD